MYLIEVKLPLPPGLLKSFGTMELPAIDVADMTLKHHSVPIISFGSLLELFYCDTVFSNGDNEQYKKTSLRFVLKTL